MTKETVALREYFDMKICKLEKIVDAKIIALKEATTLAKETMDSRLEGMNEFRAALKDQSITFITRNEFSIIVEKLQLEIQLLKEFRAELKGKASQNQSNISLIIAFAGLALGVLAMLK